MKRFIKLSLVAIALLSFAASAYARTDNIDAPKADKGWFQYGVNVRTNVMVYASEQALTLSGGYRFNKKNYLGLNLGVARAEWTDDSRGQTHPYTAVPVALDYIHNFYLGKARKHSIYLGGEAGIGCSSKTVKYEDGEEHELGYGILTLKTGLDFQLHNRLHLNLGIRVGYFSLGAGVGISF